MAATMNFLYNFLPGMVQKRLQDWRENSRSISILITGKTGIGKSTLVNGLVGEILACEGDSLESMTSEVKAASKTISGVDVKVWDSPGLQDGSENEEKYLEDIKSKCKDKVDLFIYCHDMSENRFNEGGTDIVAMKKLTATLGKEIWENGIIVLTMANMAINDAKVKFSSDQEKVEKEFRRILTIWRSSIRSALQNEVKLDTAFIGNIAIVPAGHYNAPLLLPSDQETWLSHLWFLAMKACKSSAQPAFINVNRHRLKMERQHVTASRKKQLIHEQFISCINMAQKIGDVLGVPPHIAKTIGYSDGIDQSVLLYAGLDSGVLYKDEFIAAAEKCSPQPMPDRRAID